GSSGGTSNVTAPHEDSAPGPGAAESVDLRPAPVGSVSRWRPSTVAFASGLILTAALALTALAVYNRNERRLLNLRVRELSLVVQSTAPSIQTPLASAAALADATGGSPQHFRSFMAPYVGRGRQFTSVSLWPV